MIAVLHDHRPYAYQRAATPPARSLRRIYQPIASPWLYLAGLMLVLAITAPFWLGLFESPSGPPVVFTEESPQETTPWSRPNTEPSRRTAPLSPLDQFEGLYLDAPREALERRFTLHRRNTRGMEPEIYEGRGGQSMDWVVMYFYQNRLKEFLVIQTPRVATVDEILRLLRIQYGEPADWSDGEGSPARTVAGWPLSESDSARYDRFALFRRFLWRDDQHELSVAIHYTSSDPVTCESVVIARCSAHAWLSQHHRHAVPVESTTSDPPPASSATNDLPTRWFP
ncbi:MAG: hypothetical protein NZ483_03730 [Verrucomicrobiae bacterium]|nr:hypothetical protein [Verrucomicrobiae bacterium]MDW8344649.1 hypothetical protein [Verrucomicrobiae bacterium]